MIKGLEELGHEVLKLGVGSDLGPIRHAFTELEPDIAFNLLVALPRRRHLRPARRRATSSCLRKRYTGCNPRGLMLARDKGLSKELLAYHRIRVAALRGVSGRQEGAQDRPSCAYPLVVKSLNEEASLGISQASLVTSDEKLKERVEFMHETFDVDVIAEEYVEGRELYVGVVGNQRLHTFPIWELTSITARGRAAHRDRQGQVGPRRTRRSTRSRATAPRTCPPACAEQIAAHVHAHVPRAEADRLRAHRSAARRPTARSTRSKPTPIPTCSEKKTSRSAPRPRASSYPELLQRIVNLGLNYRAAWDTAD